MDAGARGDGNAGDGESPVDVTAEEQTWDEAMHQAMNLARADPPPRPAGAVDRRGRARYRRTGARRRRQVQAPPHESGGDPACLRLPALRWIPAQAIVLIAVVEGLDFAIVGVEPVQLGDAAVSGEEEGVGGYCNHIHRMPGAPVGFPECGDGALGGKLPVPLLFPLDPDAVEVRRPRDGAGPGERAREEPVIVEKAADRFQLSSDAIRGFEAVGGSARSRGDVEVVARRFGNRLAGPGKSPVEVPHCRQHVASVHLRGKPVLVADVCLEEVEVAGIERRVVLDRLGELLQGMTPRNA